MLIEELMTTLENAFLMRRLRPFIDAGLVPVVPTPSQLRQGTIEMSPYVLGTDPLTEAGYNRTAIAHPILRQPLVFFEVGLDHLRTGSALESRHTSLCAHLQLTHHRGMPVFDLQLVQTHEHGLARLRRSMEWVLHDETARARIRHRLARAILVEADAYFLRFLGPAGWIARAERFDYPSPADEGTAMPPEFYSLVGFVNHCATELPRSLDEIPRSRRPAHLARLAGRRFREVGALGWLR